MRSFVVCATQDDVNNVMRELLHEFYLFIRERKKLWIIPILLILLLLSGLITLTAGSALAPFIYSLF